jgi:hypothetical protein
VEDTTTNEKQTMQTNQDNSNEEPAMMAGKRGMDPRTAQIKIRNWYYNNNKKLPNKINR